MANSGVNSSKSPTAAIVGGAYNATAPVLTDGKACAIQEDINGNAKVNIIVNQAGAEVPTSGKIGRGNSSKPTTSETVGGTYNASTVTLQDGQAAAIQLDLNGNLKFNIVIEAS